MLWFKAISYLFYLFLYGREKTPTGEYAKISAELVSSEQPEGFASWPKKAQERWWFVKRQMRGRGLGPHYVNNCLVLLKYPELEDLAAEENVPQSYEQIVREAERQWAESKATNYSVEYAKMIADYVLQHSNREAIDRFNALLKTIGSYIDLFKNLQVYNLVPAGIDAVDVMTDPQTDKHVFEDVDTQKKKVSSKFKELVKLLEDFAKTVC